ncbi:MAG: radical SAM protein [Dehalococcoidia bacterium]|nr:radical SAM protein [Dehalococcoidia bacterium]
MNWKTLQKARERLAREQGTLLKDWGGKTSIALIYPNSYFLGMSNLGFQTLYELLNRNDCIVCERVFWEGDETVSLESQRPLGDFDVLAFSFSYELDYLNAARVLKSSSIPLFASERGEQHPLIIAGGAAVTANPGPLSSMIDCFAIGEGEEILPRMTQIILDGVDSPRKELLIELARVPGIYVPSIPNPPIVRQSVANLSETATTSIVLTPDTELGDLYLMEIARGCSWGCRFCLAGFHFRPVRYRPVEKILEQAIQGSKYRKRMGLVSAAISDHPQIDELVVGLRKRGIEFSVSSIRIKPLSDVLLHGLADSGTKTVTLAPEAGSERLRQVIKKGITEDDILKAADRIAGIGLRQLKLYFMVGLPTETDDDISDIIKLALAARDIAGKHRSGTQLTLNITPFVPKPGTPFQWLPMATADVLKHRLSMLKKGLNHKGLEVKADSIEWSLIQGMLSRGDWRMGEVISNLPRGSLSEWQKAMEKAGIDPGRIHREIPQDEPLSWSIIDSGIKPAHLRAEMEKALGSYGESNSCTR